MALTHGMDVAQVRTLGNLLQTKAGEIETLIGAIESQIASTPWEGTDARRFKDNEWPSHAANLRNVATAIRDFGVKAGTEADQQDAASQ